MKNLSLLSFAVIAALSGPILAETPVSGTSTDACLMVGPLPDVSAECAARRAAYQSEIRSCMVRLHAAADQRAGQPTTLNGHTNRARFLICDKEAREFMALSGD